MVVVVNLGGACAWVGICQESSRHNISRKKPPRVSWIIEVIGKNLVEASTPYCRDLRVLGENFEPKKHSKAHALEKKKADKKVHTAAETDSWPPPKFGRRGWGLVLP